MSERLTIYQQGDRFATISPAGKATIWEVDAEGQLIESPIPREPEFRMRQCWTCGGQGSIRDGRGGSIFCPACHGTGTERIEWTWMRPTDE